MFADVHHHVEVPGRTAVVAYFPFAGEPDARPRVHPGGNLHRQLGLGVELARALALRAGVGDDLSGAAAGVARAGDREEALGEADLARAATGGAGAALSGLRA